MSADDRSRLVKLFFSIFRFFFVFGSRQFRARSSFRLKGSEFLWYSVKLGWCVGRNPPFVLCGIRLIGLPAPSGRYFIGDRLPFPLAGQPFQRSTLAHSALCMHHCQVQLDVSFLLCCQASRLLLFCEECNSTCGRSFLRPFTYSGSDSHTPTRQPNKPSSEGT